MTTAMITFIIILVLIKWHGSEIAAREAADYHSRRFQRGEHLTPEQRREMLDALDPDSWQARAIARGETSAEVQFGGPVAPRKGGIDPDQKAILNRLLADLKEKA